MWSLMEKHAMKAVAFAGGLSMIYFVSHAYTHFHSFVTHHATTRREADILMNTVCRLPQADFPGNFVDCSAVKSAATEGDGPPLIVAAIESTTNSLLNEMMHSLKAETSDILHALGMTSFVVIGVLMLLWFYMQKALHANWVHNQKTAYSSMYQSRQRTLIEMPDEDADAPEVIQGGIPRLGGLRIGGGRPHRTPSSG